MKIGAKWEKVKPREQKISKIKSSSPKTKLSYRFSKEGPVIKGNKVVISASESHALLNRYFEHLPHFVEKEDKNKNRQKEDVLGAAHVLATIRACADTYDRVPDEDEMTKMNTELARKFDLFYKFILDMMMESFGYKNKKKQIKKK